ncbi:hypothetical protein NIIDMKKI_17830 [Mycobacterium kansasii]|uniref:Uncharacterized protein n=1 Tax=Mycobacterium kansasii TaxID=1768 RepID=A0A7G1I6H7_MYCKA|nr:hypothetical protein NIIDMKKI_17830 [Mycobacterium kansasii]
MKALILDSPVLSRHDIVLARDALRRLLLKGDGPETAALAPKVRRLVGSGVMSASAAQVAAAIYGYGGAKLLGRQLDLLLDGRTMLWRALCRVTTVVDRKVPYRYENDLVSRIAFRELDYAAEPDGLPSTPRWRCGKPSPPQPFSKQNHMTWWPRCRNSAGRRWWFPVAATSSPRPRWRNVWRRWCPARCS